MKKVFVLGICMFMLCGCSVTEKFECTVEGKSAKITLKDGMISSYSLDGIKVNRQEIDEINGEYFTGVASPEDGRRALQNYIATSNGSCNMGD